jgi:CRISPR-associated endonuclease/helicase Cas3
VGCVAAELITLLPRAARALLPPGSATLAALHDIGKITLGFQIKAPAWLLNAKLDAEAQLNAPFSVSDHALVSQVFVQELLKPSGAQLWAAAVGAHHGRPKGRFANLNARPEAMKRWAESHRYSVTRELIEMLGPIPDRGPHAGLGNAHSDLWLLAGLITVADWIGSNEAFFPPQHGQSPDETRQLAAAALYRIGWPGGALRSTRFHSTFGFDPNPIQQATGEAAVAPGLIVVEAPMGCGKTEAALRAAQQLIAAGHHHGFYFALPTQVTSNRIHRRIAAFLNKTLADPAQLRLAHANAWLEDDFDLRLEPAFSGWTHGDGDHPAEMVREARSWFASSKQALLAPYGVGTIDQALQGVVAVKHFFVRRFALAGKVVILDEIHSYDVYTGTLVTALVRELVRLGCSVIILSATLTVARRRELLAAAGCDEPDSLSSYPLISACTPAASVQTFSPGRAQSKRVALRCDFIPEEKTVETLIARAEAGQHVLWIRNTVIEAQQAFRAVRSSMREGELPLGLLHSRFPFQHRADLEDEWLDRLGRNRPKGGSILIATQVVEQSVDIDLDFIVADLAPTDMLLQRMGRLWRHERPVRAAAQPEFWVGLPQINRAADARELTRAFGRSARVYAPYVLLRTAEIWQRRSGITLPDDIRPLLEATYADPSSDEMDGWRELREELDAEKGRLNANADAAMRVFGLPMLDPEDDKALTRRKGPPTIPVLLLPSVVSAPGNTWHLTSLDGSSVQVSEHEWRMAAARFLYRWLVRVPRWQVPGDAPRPRWLGLHVHGDATYACVQDDGRLRFGDAVSTSSYHKTLGVFAEHPGTAAPPTSNWNDDDEFDS